MVEVVAVVVSDDDGGGGGGGGGGGDHSGGGDGDNDDGGSSDGGGGDHDYLCTLVYSLNLPQSSFLFSILSVLFIFLQANIYFLALLVYISIR